MFDYHSTLLLKKFKKFISQEKSLFELDFRKHVYLENNVGLYPTYNYKTAEIIIDHLFMFLEKYRITKYSQANKKMMIEDLRMTRLNSYIASILVKEIKWSAMNKNIPQARVNRVRIVNNAGGSYLSINIDPKTRDFICSESNYTFNKKQASDEKGFINIQLPINSEPTILIGDDRCVYDMNTSNGDPSINNMINKIISNSVMTKIYRDYELEELFSTANIKTYGKVVNHSYNNSLDLVLLENIETKETYVTMERKYGKGLVLFPVDFKVFENFKMAAKYIDSHCQMFDSLDDCRISNNIHQELVSFENTHPWL